MCSSEELEWELFEIFENALFAFPVYDHKSARQIVRYLLNRGVLEEEIADAIEESTFDLMVWLNRSGKQMVGEWVISWINETREEYEQEVEVERMHLEQLERDLTPGRSIATSESGDTDFGSDARVRQLEPTAPTLSEAPAGGASLAACSLDSSDLQESEYDIDNDNVTDTGSDNGGLHPPRTLRRKWSKKGKHPPVDLHPDPDESSDLSSEVARHHSPPTDMDEGATGSSSPTTTHSSSIPSDFLDSDPGVTVTVVTEADFNQNRKCNNCTLASTDIFQVDKNGLPVKSQCACTLAHYSYIKELTEAEQKQQDYADLYLTPEKNDRALEVNVDTLDKDGPGFIFIMTDSLRECMPWSAESRYKVASSRKPERCLLEFRTRNVDIDLIWQVKVEHHVMAVKEVHKTLHKYNLHSNWFRCSLSEIMEAISKVIKKYKHK